MPLLCLNGKPYTLSFSGRADLLRGSAEGHLAAGHQQEDGREGTEGDPGEAPLGRHVRGPRLRHRFG